MRALLAFFVNLPNRLKRDRRLGIAEGRRRYDLPLNRDSGSDFLRLLIALMSFLTIMAMVFFFAMHGLANRWSSGLENKLTIEIPAEDTKGEILSQERIAELQEKAESILQKNPYVKEADILDSAEMHDLIKPWFGEDLSLTNLPMPGLVSVELHESAPEIVAAIAQDLQEMHAPIRVDAHESWLNEVLRLAGSLQIAALFVGGIIVITTITAIAGAVRSRIAIYRADVELLHLMGASDMYITRQFQRHALILALQGSIAGTALALTMILGIQWLAQGDPNSLMPEVSLSYADMLAILMLPLAACILAGLTARLTVLRSLSMMP